MVPADFARVSPVAVGASAAGVHPRTLAFDDSQPGEQAPVGRIPARIRRDL